MGLERGLYLLLFRHLPLMVLEQQLRLVLDQPQNVGIRRILIARMPVRNF